MRQRGLPQQYCSFSRTRLGSILSFVRSGSSAPKLPCTLTTTFMAISVNVFSSHRAIICCVTTLQSRLQIRGMMSHPLRRNFLLRICRMMFCSIHYPVVSAYLTFSRILPGPFLELLSPDC